jgi:NAD(P)-dependent dehydrogenase (short-subunit alcohol dehydrogenase family)
MHNESCETIASTHVCVTGVNSDAELIEMDLECSALRTALDINVMGSAMCARAALPELIKTKGQVSKARAFVDQQPSSFDISFDGLLWWLALCDGTAYDMNGAMIVGPSNSRSLAHFGPVNKSDRDRESNKLLRTR